MPDCDGLDNNFEGSTDDEVALMSRKFKEMMKKKLNKSLLNNGTLLSLL